MKLQEFCPRKEKIAIEGKTFILSLFTLDHEIWALENFESLEVMQSQLKEPTEERPYILFELLFELIENKPDYDFDNFMLYFNANNLTEYAGKIFNVVNRILVKSFPDIENVERMKDYNKTMENQAAPNKNSYAIYYEKMAARHGISIEAFLKLTPRQLFSILNAMNLNEYDELSLQAALQGRKLKEQNTLFLVDSKTEKVQEQDAMEMLKQMKDRHLQKVAQDDK